MSSGIGHQRYSPCDWLDLELSPNSLPGELTVQKKFSLYPLRLRLAATWDISAGALRTKASVKERLLGGSFRYLHSEQALEYRKRFSLLGLACAHVWSRWDLSAAPLYPPYFSGHALPASSSAWWRPRLGVGLSLGDSKGDWGPLPLQLLGGGAGGVAGAAGSLLLRPLSHPFKAVLPAGPGLRLKARCEASLRLPRRLSLWGGEGLEGAGAENADEYGNPYGDPYGDGGSPGLGGSGVALRLRLNRAALVLDL